MRPSGGHGAFLSAALGTALVAGCSTAARDGGAILRPVCAPNDAAAVELVVPASSAAYPQLRIWAWRSLAATAGATVTIPGPEGREGTASWCRTETECPGVASATAVFGTMRRDSSLHVTVDARLADGTRFRGSRRAQWRGRALLCG